MTTTNEAPPGLDLGRIARWLPTVVPDAGSELTAHLIAGGKSNLTYAISDGRQSWILRRPPLGHVLATAHDMGREYRVMAALAQTEVPVPTTIAFCSDESVLGVPFYVMELVDGVPYRSATELTALGARRVRTISERLVDTLAALHTVDPAEVGLADFGKPKGFLERQVRRWRTQMDASGIDLPASAQELHDLLIANVPPESRPGVVHGDFRLDNLLMNAADEPAALIDWEMATIGDPLTDLAMMVVYGRLPQLGAGDAVSDVTLATGYSPEHEVIARYRAHSARDMSNFGFYLALASFKLAAIIAGIHARFLQGKTVGSGFADLGDAIPLLLEAGIDELKGQN